jgi:hypothetical protein
VKVVPSQIKLRHLRFPDFDSRRISPIVNFAMDFEPFSGGGSGDRAERSPSDW